MNVNSATAMGQFAYLNYTTAAKNKTFSSMTSSNDGTSDLLNTSTSSASASDKLWSNVFADSSSSQSQILATMKKYTATSEKFYSSFASTSTNLKNSSTNLTSVLENPAASASDITDSIKTFANDYNKTTALFKDNARASSTMSSFADSFASSTKSAKNSLAAIGISVDTNGKMTVDETALTTAVQNNPSAIKAVFSGNQGLGNQAYFKTSLAVSNVENFVPFPDITSFTSAPTSLGLLADMFA